MGSWMNSKLPLASDLTVRTSPVPLLNAITVTSGTTAPLLSVTVP